MSVIPIDHRPYSLDPMERKDPLSTLLEGIKILEGKHWWLSAGTLLGLYRDKGFIPHDTDIDVAVLGDIDREGLGKDFELVRSVTERDGRHMQSAYIHLPSMIIFDILHYWPDGEDYYTESEKGKLFRPTSIIDKLGTLEHGGHEFPVPGDVEYYLELWYGDWRTPRTGGKTNWIK